MPGGARVTAGLVDDYCAATGVGPGARGIPPLLSIIAGYPLLFAAVDSVTPPGARHLTVHGEHELVVVRPLRVGDELTAHAEVESVAAVKPGTAVTVRIDVSAAGDPVAIHRAVAIVRGTAPDVEFGDPPPPPAAEPDAWRGSVRVPIGADQPARYADATGDHNAVHVDDAAARAAGFPGVIAHGLGVFGLALGGLVDAVADGDHDRVRRARVRFGPPVLPGQDLTVQWAAEDAVAFRVLDASGAAVLRAGVLELG